MSDFITNLAARSAGAAESIQPRVPGLFEPPAVGSHLPAAPQFATTEQERADQPDLRSEVRPPVIPQPVAGTPADRRVAADHPRTPAGELTLSPAPPTTSQSPAPEALTQALKSAAPRPAELPPAPVLSPQPLVRQPLETPSAGPALQRISPSKQREPETVRKEPSADKEQPAQPAVSRKELPSPAAAQPVRPASTIVEPRVTPRTESPRPAPPPSPARSPEPVIQVTIGRIDVRATPETSPARKAHAAAPVTGLDEYLRSRAKRGNA